MKATEILNKRLVIDSTWYGYANHEIVDFEITKNGRIVVNYDDHFNGLAHIYNLTFSVDEIEKMLNGEEVVVMVNGEVDTITKYSLIFKHPLF